MVTFGSPGQEFMVVHNERGLHLGEMGKREMISRE